jgi:hypothetical protein
VCAYGAADQGIYCALVDVTDEASIGINTVLFDDDADGGNEYAFVNVIAGDRRDSTIACFAFTGEASYGILADGVFDAVVGEGCALVDVVTGEASFGINTEVVGGAIVLLGDALVNVNAWLSFKARNAYTQDDSWDMWDMYAVAVGTAGVDG